MIEHGGTRISTAVMTHPKRLEHARALRDSHPELGLRVVVDPDPEGPPSSVRSARLVWEAAGADATHHLVLEDDVALCADFRDQVLAAVRARPDAVVSLHAAATSRTGFAGRLALLRGSPWTVPVGPYVPTVGVVLPVRAARAFAAYIADRAVLADHHDELLKRFLDGTRLPALVTVPNLVDHRPLPTLEGNVLADGRPSFCFPGDGGPVDWTAEPTRPSIVPYLMYPPHRHAVGLLPTVARNGEPPSRAAVELLQESGVPLPALMAEFVDALDGLGAAAGPVEDIVFPLWCTAALLGTVHRVETGTEGDAADAARRPLVERSLHAWAAAVLDKRAGADRAAATARLAAFLSRGVTAGLAPSRGERRYSTAAS
jgi:hypothetical protein